MIRAEQSGYVIGFDCRAIGEAARSLGAGRLRIDDVIDPAVGIEVSVELGDPVDAESTVFTVHASSSDRLADS